jgi:hypothetical protein
MLIPGRGRVIREDTREKGGLSVDWVLVQMYILHDLMTFLRNVTFGKASLWAFLGSESRVLEE